MLCVWQKNQNEKIMALGTSWHLASDDRTRRGVSCAVNLKYAPSPLSSLLSPLLSSLFLYFFPFIVSAHPPFRRRSLSFRPFLSCPFKSGKPAHFAVCSGVVQLYCNYLSSSLLRYCGCDPIYNFHSSASLRDLSLCKTRK